MEDELSELNVGVDEVERAARERNVLALVNALEHPSSHVRIAASRALGEVGGDKARFALLSLARDRYGERPDVRIAALGALGDIFDEEGYAYLLEGFTAVENKKVMAAAREMLEAVDPDGFPRRLARNGCLDPAAMNVYGRTGEETAVPLLASFLEERVDRGDLAGTGFWGKVYAAVRALGRIGGPGATEALEHLLGRLPGGGEVPEGFLRKERLEKIESAARDALARSRGR